MVCWAFVSLVALPLIGADSISENVAGGLPAWTAELDAGTASQLLSFKDLPPPALRVLGEALLKHNNANTRGAAKRPTAHPSALQRVSELLRPASQSQEKTAPLDGVASKLPMSSHLPVPSAFVETAATAQRAGCDNGTIAYDCKNIKNGLAMCTDCPYWP
eukprot:TRINITY_DN82836_c0_g1_i1.p1 TRINITY_DN82836_c0_g1~~TRINITY_DN82836_c0_g1_i1.p1  ORF type:complete len:161 (-),score=27.81 TRINITY_DN82836_c0_g1_i1:164-646(-)